MGKIEDVLTGLMIIIADLVTGGIVAVGLFLVFSRTPFVSLTLMAAAVFLTLYILRSIYRGFHIIFHGRYRDETTARENSRYAG